MSLYRRSGEQPDFGPEQFVCLLQLMENQMTKFLNRFAKDESGATAIEYGLIATLIALAIVVAASAVGTGLNDKFAEIAAALS